MDASGNDKGILWNMVRRSPWWVPWLFLFLLWFGWAVYQFHVTSTVSQVNQEARELIRESSMQQCERINDMRAESNARSEILRSVLGVAAEAALEDGDTETAALYIENRQSLRDHEMIDCHTAFPEDMEQAGFFSTSTTSIQMPVDAEE